MIPQFMASSLLYSETSKLKIDFWAPSPFLSRQICGKSDPSSFSITQFLSSCPQTFQLSSNFQPIIQRICQRANDLLYCCCWMKLESALSLFAFQRKQRGFKFMKRLSSSILSFLFGSFLYRHDICHEHHQQRQCKIIYTWVKFHNFIEIIEFCFGIFSHLSQEIRIK